MSIHSDAHFNFRENITKAEKQIVWNTQKISDKKATI
jgi:hypothetical protein